MPSILSEKTLHITGRIDQCTRDYFTINISVNEIKAKDLMPLFIQKEIFDKDSRAGWPIRKLLRQLDDVDKLSLLQKKSKKINRDWYFVR